MVGINCSRDRPRRCRVAGADAVVAHAALERQPRAKLAAARESLVAAASFGSGSRCAAVEKGASAIGGIDRLADGPNLDPIGNTTMSLSDLSREELTSLHADLTSAYDELVAWGLELDLTRGKPAPAQLDLSNGLLELPGKDSYTDSAGTDCRNYGGTMGLLEIREIFAPLLNVPVEQLVAGDNASLAIMHDTLVYALLKGTTAPTGRGSRLRPVFSARCRATTGISPVPPVPPVPAEGAAAGR